MLESFKPDEWISSVYELNLDKLRKNGRRLLLFDLDNTLVPWNHPDLPEPLMQWLELARKHGFEICILSNNSGPRVREFAKRAGVAYIADAGKPQTAAYYEAMNKFSASPEETVMVGDQLLTDIHGGRKAGVYTVLVLPIAKSEWWGTRINRQVEKLILYMLHRKFRFSSPVQKKEFHE
ncbi:MULTISPECIES: YqeG family HAD IIIA-type phosphatase [Alicyclobacillus]|uniref:YqeG family HAD IIIA-type phosphatase n=1 Tax=Alicyclobacillus TaxID=29330 RepID=UPI0009336730|nr:MULTISPECIES: YqeG family HAD IIIA-type phosphatase [Alicyclobacillus]